MRHALVGGALLAAGAALAGAWACNDTGAYVFVARELDPRGCLGAVTTLDVLNGNDPGLGCRARCFVSTVDEAGSTSVYGTTMCGPAPPGFDATEKDPRCVTAKAAVARADVCLADGGETAPPDSGPDAGDSATADSAIVDAATDGSTDASGE